MFFVFGREEKGVEKIQAESRTPGVSFFFLVGRVPRAFYSPSTLYEVVALQGMPPSRCLGLG